MRMTAIHPAGTIATRCGVGSRFNAGAAAKLRRKELGPEASRQASIARRHVIVETEARPAFPNVLTADVLLLRGAEPHTVDGESHSRLAAMGCTSLSRRGAANGMLAVSLSRYTSAIPMDRLERNPRSDCASIGSMECIDSCYACAIRCASRSCFPPDHGVGTTGAATSSHCGTRRPVRPGKCPLTPAARAPATIGGDRCRQRTWE